jgi:hypothetical protein
VSDDAPFPRDDRSWPQGAFTFSMVCGVLSLAVSAALLVSAGSPQQVAALGIAFIVAAGAEAAAYVAGIRPWLAGGSVPKGLQVAQVGLVLVAFLSFAAGPEFGGAVLCGFFAGLFLPNAAAIFHARTNREMVEQGELRLAEARTDEDPEPDDSEPMPRGMAPRVGRVLRAELAEERGRCLAWAAAAVVAVLGCVAAGERDVASGVGFVAAVVLVWVGRRLLGVWRALRDYEKSETEPRRAYVALLNDPNARVTRPLLGVWSEEPLSHGRLPRAEAVFRCDEERSALMSPPGRVVVHEAWVDTGKRSRARPRWVVADAGLALPHRGAALGRWYLASLIGSERPARARPLTVQSPHPDTEPSASVGETLISEKPALLGPWARQFAWRLAGLLALALLFVWMD